jgi:hypothetical protein
MALNRNFDTRLLIAGGLVEVTGSSDAIEDFELLSRHVSLAQDGTLVQGPANLNEKWAAVPKLPAAGLKAAPALATGCETFAVASQPGVSSFATFTWSQVVELVETGDA